MEGLVDALKSESHVSSKFKKEMHTHITNSITNICMHNTVFISNDLKGNIDNSCSH